MKIPPVVYPNWIHSQPPSSCKELLVSISCFSALSLMGAVPRRFQEWCHLLGYWGISSELSWVSRLFLSFETSFVFILCEDFPPRQFRTGIREIIETQLAKALREPKILFLKYFVGREKLPSHWSSSDLTRLPKSLSHTVFHCLWKWQFYLQIQWSGR